MPYCLKPPYARACEQIQEAPSEHFSVIESFEILFGTDLPDPTLVGAIRRSAPVRASGVAHLLPTSLSTDLKRTVGMRDGA